MAVDIVYSDGRPVDEVITDRNTARADADEFDITPTAISVVILSTLGIASYQLGRMRRKRLDSKD